MKPCEVCGKSHHLHTENDLSNCLVWANDDNRQLKAEIEQLRDIEAKARKYCEAMTSHMERPTYMGTQYAMAVCWRDLAEALTGGEF